MPLEVQHFGTEMGQTKTDLAGLNEGGFEPEKVRLLSPCSTKETSFVKS